MCHAKSASPGYNRCFVEFECMRIIVAYKGVPRLVNSCVQSIFLRHTEAFALNAHHDAVACKLEVIIISFLSNYTKQCEYNLFKVPYLFLWTASVIAVLTRFSISAPVKPGVI